MPQFVVTRKLKTTDPDADRWQEIVEQCNGIEILRYGSKMIVRHDDEAQLHVAVSGVADIKRM